MHNNVHGPKWKGAAHPHSGENRLNVTGRHPSADNPIDHRQVALPNSLIGESPHLFCGAVTADGRIDGIDTRINRGHPWKTTESGICYV